MEMEGNSATDPFRGTMDELAIWNRELSAAEIAQLYNGGAGISPLATLSAPTLSIEGDASSITFSWDSLPGMIYTLRSSETLTGDPALWPVHLTHANIAADPPLNTLDISLPAANAMFFVVEESAAP
jgi:hypothetical protein